MINGIGSTSLSGIAGQAQRADGLSRTSKPAVAQEDRAAVVTTTIAQLASGGAPVDTSRVDAIRAAIKAGTYKADPGKIADAMISSDLGVSK